MPHDQLVLAQTAVVSELNDADRAWPLAFTAARAYLPLVEATALTTLTVSVIPLGRKNEKISRTHELETFDIGIDIQQRVTPTDTDTIDTLIRLVGKILDWFSDGHNLATMPTLKVNSVENPEAYNMPRLHYHRIFESYIVVTLTGAKDQGKHSELLWDTGGGSLLQGNGGRILIERD